MDHSRPTDTSMFKRGEHPDSPMPPPFAQTKRTDSTSPALEDDSAITVLRHLEDERGKLFTEAEYQELRRTILEELAHGARLRPFTLFTFGVVAAGLLALFVVGLVTATGTSARDLALAIVSGAAIIAAGYFFWSCWQGIKLDALRSLESRLAEVKQLLELRLISSDEYELIESHILIARQQSRSL